MPERTIQVTEYKCERCSYQWISRTLNEKYKDKDKPVKKKQHYIIRDYSHRHFNYPREWSDEMYVNYKPSYCPKCKSRLWDYEPMDAREKYLRLKLVGGTRNYDKYGVKVQVGKGPLYGNSITELTYVCACFLYKIRPTVEELYRVIGDDEYQINCKTREYLRGPFGEDDVKWTDGDDAISYRRQEIMLEILKDH